MTMKIFAAAAAVCAALALTACGDKEAANAKTADEPIIGIVQLVEHQALDAANKGIVDALKDRGIKAKLDQQNAQADQSNLRNIAQRFVSEKASLIFAIATPAAQTVANATATIPIVATAVTNFEIAKLVKSEKQPDTNVTGSSDLNPVTAQLDLMLKLVPNAKRIATIYNSSEINSQFQVDILKKAVQDKGLELTVLTVNTVNDVQQAAQSLVGKVDAIYVPTDNVIASAMPVLAKITMPAKIPVVTGEVGAMKAGDGIGTVGVDYYQLGRIAGDMGADILQGKAKPETMAVRHQETFKAIINERVAKACGLTIPDDLRQSAEIIQ